MSTERLLFVGGPVDGQRKEVHIGRYFVFVAVPCDPLTKQALEASRDACGLDMVIGPQSITCEYHRERIRGIHGEWSVMLYQGLTADDMINGLMANYHKSGETTRGTCARSER